MSQVFDPAETCKVPDRTSPVNPFAGLARVAPADADVAR